MEKKYSMSQDINIQTVNKGLEDALMAELVQASIAEAQTYDDKFDEIFTKVVDELVDELEMGLRSRFIRLMLDQYVTDDSVSDDGLRLALTQVEEASHELEYQFFFKLQEAVQHLIKARPVHSLDVSIVRQRSEFKWSM